MTGQTLLDFRGNPNRYGSEELRAHHRRFVELVEEFVTAEPQTRTADIHAESARLGARFLEREAQLAFWKRELAGLPEVTALPLDRPRPVERAGAGEVVGFAVDADVQRRAALLAEEAGTGIFTTLHAALAVLLGRLGDTDDVVIGTPVVGREASDSDDPEAGAFFNKTVLRSQVDTATSFVDHLSRVRDADRAAFAHAALPFDDLVATLGAESDPSHAPLFQVMLEFTDGGHPHYSSGDVTVSPIQREHRALGLDLVFSLTESETGGIIGRLRFATDVWDRAGAEALAARFVRILQTVTADPAAPIGDVDLLEQVEYAELAPVRDEPSVEPRTLPALLARAVEAGGDGDALVYQGRSLTYRELDAQSDRLARMLIGHGVGTGFGCGAGDRAIDRIGAGHLGGREVRGRVRPGRPELSGRSHRAHAHRFRCGVGLTVAAHRSSLPEITPWFVMDDASFGRDLAQHAAGTVADPDRLRPLRTADPAYLIYTSGSTGTPKGVVVTHIGLANFAEDERQRFAVTAESRTLHFSSPSFDASILELLHRGAVPAPRWWSRRRRCTAVPNWRTCCVANGSRTRSSPPPRSASVDPTGLDHIRCVVTGGETLSAGTGGAVGAGARTCSTRTARPRPPSSRASARTVDGR